MKAPVTLLDVAMSAKVSKSTVANVFNRPERVRPELRQRVEAAARELGYAGPDPKGRLLSSGKVNAIGVVPPADAGFSWSFEHPYMREFLTGVSEVCEEHGAGLLLISAKDKSGRSGIGDAVVDGMILGTAEQAQQIEPGLRRRLPFVVIDADGGQDMSSIRFDERDGVRKLIHHLLQLGHRRFAFASVSRSFGKPILTLRGKGSPGLKAGYDQEQISYGAAAEALAEAGLAIDDMPLIEACGNDEEVRRFGNFGDLLLDNAADSTAFVSFSGTLTEHLLESVLRRGLKVPDQVSVAGFGERRSAALTDPSLTVVVQPISATERGRLAARMLFDSGPPQHLLLPVELVVGASTAHPAFG
jgi:DNA-binding LacI/PurR family transcriptional regulator